MKNDNKNYKIPTTVFLSVIVTITLFMLIAVIMYWINRDNPSRFAYDSDLYGTIDGWVMIAVTTATGIVIYLTLNSQMKVQKDQNRMFKIEEFKYLRDNKPVIKFHETRQNLFIDGKIIGVEYTVNLNWDKFCRIKRNYYTNSQVHLSQAKFSSYSNKGSGDFTMIIPISKAHGDSILYLDIEYQDYDGNTYLMEYQINFTITDNSTVATKKTLLSDNIINKVY